MAEQAGEVLLKAISRLKEAKAKKPERDARILLCLALGKDKAFILAHPEFEVDEKTAKKYLRFVRRRSDGEPIQYITGLQPFWKSEIKVGKGALIPRAETEVLVEKLIELAAKFKRPKIIDLGCGSGAILKAVAETSRDSSLIGIEKEGEALRWAKANLDGYKNVKLVKGDFYNQPFIFGADIIVGNPPYLSQKEFDALPVEIKKHEPKSSLLAKDPLEPYRNIARWGRKALNRNGFLLVEIGSEQAKRIKAFDKIFEPLALFGKIRDYGSRLRVLLFKKTN